MGTKHKTIAEIEVEIDADNCAYPEIEITYTATKGDPGCMYQRNGDPGWPPEPPELEFISAKLVKGDGMTFKQETIDKMAEAWLESDDGYRLAVRASQEREDA